MKEKKARVGAPEVLTLEEVAGLLRLNKRSVVRLVKEGKLPGVKLGRVWRFSREQVLQLLQEGGGSTPVRLDGDGC